MRAEFNIEIKNLLDLAIWYDWQELYEFILNYIDLKPSIKNNAIKNNALLIATTKNNTNLVEKLINKGANVNRKSANKSTPLINTSANAGNIEIVKLLLQNGAYKTINDGQLSIFPFTALIFAVVKAYPEIKEHISKGVYIDIVKLLLQNGAKLTGLDTNIFQAMVSEVIRWLENK